MESKHFFKYRAWTIPQYCMWCFYQCGFKGYSLSQCTLAACFFLGITDISSRTPIYFQLLDMIKEKKKDFGSHNILTIFGVRKYL